MKKGRKTEKDIVLLKNTSRNLVGKQDIIAPLLAVLHIDFVDIANARHSLSTLGFVLAYCNIALLLFFRSEGEKMRKRVDIV